MHCDINFDISGKVVVITGAGGVLCGTMARQMAKLGARVALLDIRLENTQQIANEMLSLPSLKVRLTHHSYAHIKNCGFLTISHLNIAITVQYFRDHHTHMLVFLHIHQY